MIKTTARSYLYWSMAALFYLYEMVLRASLGIMESELRVSFRLDAEMFGFLSSAYYWAYTPLQLPCGVILDKLGARLLITGSCLICVLGAFMFGMTDTLWVAFVARFLIGAGSACAFVSTLSLVTGWFARKDFALMAGLTNMMGCLGGIFAGKPLARLLHGVGWRDVMLALAIMGLGLTVMTWLIIRDAPARTRADTAPGKSSLLVGETSGIASLLKDLMYVLKKPQIWLAGIVGGLVYLPLSAFAELWAIPFIEVACHMSNEDAARVPMALYVGMGLGSPVMAYLASRLGNYVTVMKGMALVATVGFSCIAFSQVFPFALILAITAFTGFILGAQMLLFTVAKDNVPTHISGTATAFTNAVIMAFGIIFQPLMGYLLDKAWVFLGGVKQAGVPLYTGQMYAYAMLSLPVCFVISWILLRFVKDTFRLQAPETPIVRT